MTKTIDGKLKLSKIIKLAWQTPGVTVVDGNKHPYILKYALAPIGNCALAKSTSTDEHIIPWFKKVTGYNPQTIYQALKKGVW